MNKKPVVTYFHGNDPTHYSERIVNNLTEVNIIRTKRLTPEFIKFLLINKNRIYLHLVVNGMGGSELEPNIPTVKSTFDSLKVLVDGGFPLKRILLMVDPVIQNAVGLKSMELILKLLTKIKGFRIQQVKFNLLPYYNMNAEGIAKHSIGTRAYIRNQNKREDDKQTYDGLHNNRNGYWVIANKNITKRQAYKQMKEFTAHMDNTGGDGSFFTYYRKLLVTFRDFINIDTVYKDPIGIRELKTFGLSTTWLDDNRVGHKIIDYDKKTREIKNVIMLFGKTPMSCPNKCILCPFR